MILRRQHVKNLIAVHFPCKAVLWMAPAQGTGGLFSVLGPSNLESKGKI